MKRLLPLAALALSTLALADPNAPLEFRLEPTSFHAYESDPPKPLTLTLVLRNPAARPVPLKCLTVGGPVLRRFTEFQDGRSVLADEALGELQPQGNAPVCRRVGEVLTVPAGAKYTYTKALGPQKVGAQVHYRSGWNVSVASGSSWLQRAYTSALVVRGARPVSTPTPEAYQAALRASRAMLYEFGHGARLSFSFIDQLSRQAFLAELKKRGLDPSKVDIEVAPPVRFPTPPPLAHTAAVRVRLTSKGYTFTLKVTNRTGGPLRVDRFSCEPLAIERLSGGHASGRRGMGRARTSPSRRSPSSRVSPPSVRPGGTARTASAATSPPVSTESSWAWVSLSARRSSR